MSGTLKLQRLAALVLGTAPTNIYTSPANTTTLLRALTFDNTTAGAVTLSLQIVLAGGGGTFNLLSNFAMPAGSSYVAREALNQVLAPGDSVSASASAAASVHCVASGATM